MSHTNACYDSIYIIYIRIETKSRIFVLYSSAGDGRDKLYYYILFDWPPYWTHGLDYFWTCPPSSHTIGALCCRPRAYTRVHVWRPCDGYVLDDKFYVCAYACEGERGRERARAYLCTSAKSGLRARSKWDTGGGWRDKIKNEYTSYLYIYISVCECVCVCI